MKICLEQMPETTDVSETHKVACWLDHPMAPKVDPKVDPKEMTTGGEKG
jgi:oligopeptide transport system ATP-binding protein